MSARLVVALLALVLEVGAANAAPVPPSVQPVVHGVRIAYGSSGQVSPAEFGRVWNSALSSGAVPVVDTINGPGPVGRKVPGVTASRTIPWSSVARGAAKVLPYAGAAWSAYEAAQLVRCYASSGNMFCDPGVEPEATTLPVWTTNGSTGSSPEASCALFVYDNFSGTTDYRITPRNPPESQNGHPVYGCSRRDGEVNGQPNYSGNYTTHATENTVPGTQCPASIDALNPANSIPAGAPVGSDGRCPTARYNHAPASENVIAERIEQHGDKTKARAIAQEVDNQGIPMEAPSPTVTGPSSIPGPTVTTTPPSGQPTTQSTTYNITYQGDTYTWNSSTSTTTGGNTTVTEGQPDPTDPCEANPDRVGCQKLTQPEDPGITPTTRTIAYTPEDLGFSGACPAPRVIVFHGWDLVLDYATACNVAPTIRLGLVALTAVSCILIIIGVTRS